VLNSFVSIAAVQVALVDTLKSVNLTPDGIIGHSVGELGCAYADGCFTAEETVLAAFARGDAITKANLAEGAMAAVGLSWEDAKKRCPEGVYPACHNAADSVSISGPPAAIDKFVEELKAEGIFAKKVQSSGQAFHSKYISQAGPMLKERLIKLLGEKKERSKRWISTSIEESKWGDEIAKWSSVDYHVNNLLSPVLFHSALAHIPKGATVIEIAPHALLQAVLKRSLPGTTNIGLMNRNAPNQTVAVLAALGKIYNSGHNPTVANIYPEVAYPVSVTTPSLSPLIQWDHSTPWDVAKFGQTTGQNIIQVDLTNELDAFIEGHCIDGRILYPATGYLVLVWKTIAKLHGTTYDKVKVVFENVDLERATILQKGGNCKFTINVLEGSGEFEVIEGGGVAVKGTVRVVENDEDMGFLQLKDLEGSQYRSLGESDVYKELRLRGYDYAGMFRGIKEVDNEGTWAKLAWESNWVSYLDTMLQFSILSQPNRGLYLPTRLQRVAIDPMALTDFVLNNKNSEKGLPAYKYKDLNVVKSRGVELRGLKASLAPRRQGIQADPKLEEYTFVPYFDESGASGSDIRTLVDIVIENTQTLKLKVTEVTRSVDTAIADQVHTVANGQPMYQDDITVLTTKSEQGKVPESWAKNGFKVVAKDEVVPPAEAVHMVVSE
jgi:fatty acid synthase